MFPPKTAEKRLGIPGLLFPGGKAAKSGETCHLKSHGTRFKPFLIIIHICRKSKTFSEKAPFTGKMIE